MTGATLLVLGGARSGKSRYAQARAEALGTNCLYFATAQAFDAEMQERIARHKAERGGQWRTIEVPLELPQAIRDHAGKDSVILVDCLTLWASNLMMAERDPEAATLSLCEAIEAVAGQLILVANEVGLGIVPDNPLARQFRDIAGRMNQAVAAAADEVTFIAAGLPLKLK